MADILQTTFLNAFIEPNVLIQISLKFVTPVWWLDIEQATIHQLNRCWRSLTMPHSISEPRWVKCLVLWHVQWLFCTWVVSVVTQWHAHIIGLNYRAQKCTIRDLIQVLFPSNQFYPRNLTDDILVNFISYIILTWCPLTVNSYIRSVDNFNLVNI